MNSTFRHRMIHCRLLLGCCDIMLGLDYQEGGSKNVELLFCKQTFHGECVTEWNMKKGINNYILTCNEVSGYSDVLRSYVLSILRYRERFCIAENRCGHVSCSKTEVINYCSYFCAQRHRFFLKFIPHNVWDYNTKLNYFLYRFVSIETNQ